MRYEYMAEVVAVIDGDTVDLKIDLGLRVFTKCRVRMAGIDCPEKKDISGWTAARDALMKFMPAGSVVVIRTEKDKTEKYGRWLGTFFNEGDRKTINQAMVDGGWAKPYDGGPR